MEFETLIITPKLDNVILRSPFHESIIGTLCITGHHLILQSCKEDLQEFWLLHHSIDIVEKLPNSAQSGGTIIIKCKNFTIFYLEVPHSVEFFNIYYSFDRLANLTNTKLLYPFFYRPMYNILEDGYALFKLESEYAKLLATDEWRISVVNKNYSICNTYSATLIVPKVIDDEILLASASFRQGGRFPVFSYKHENGTVLLRSSQPLLSNCNRKSTADENILNAILGSFKRGYIIDTRSLAYVNSCKGKGGGTEPEVYYARWKKVYKPLDKISKCDGSLTENLSKLVDVLRPRVRNYIEEVVDSFTEKEFKQNFRMNRTTFDYVLSIIHGSIQSDIIDRGRHTITGKPQLLITLWYFGTPDSFRSICSCFNVGKATALRTVRRVANELLSISQSIIMWPTGEYLNEVINGFNEMGFPNTIGCIDGMHVKIPKSKDYGISYIQGGP